ncbi:MAG: hypothetical protein AAFX46_22425, partial [Cyanobacteria bacterium J06636_27]
LRVLFSVFFSSNELLSMTSGLFIWLLEWHRGKFGRINLEMIYPFLNAFGLLMLAVTGITMWFQTRPRKNKSNTSKS